MRRGRTAAAFGKKNKEFYPALIGCPAHNVNCAGMRLYAIAPVFRSCGRRKYVEISYRG